MDYTTKSKYLFLASYNLYEDIAKRVIDDALTDDDMATLKTLEDEFKASEASFQAKMGGEDGDKKENALAINANITEDQQRQIDLATAQFRQSVERVDNQMLQKYVQAIQDGDYAEAERILEQAQEAPEQVPQVNTLMFALLTIGVILLPIYAKQRLQKLLVQFGLNTIFANTDDGQRALRKQAEKGAKSHIQTVAKDIKNALDDAIDSQLTEPSIEAGVKEKYETVADKDGEEYVKAVKKDKKIYEFARGLILSGMSRGQVIAKMQENYSDVSKRRATVIAGNESNRVFNTSQFEADSQFLAQNQLQDKAYKRLVSNTGTPEALCKSIIDKTHANPIPFKEDFIAYNKVHTYVDEKGRTKKFRASFEAIKSGTIHVNCHCRYELLIKQENGSFFNTFNGKVENALGFDEDEHRRGLDGKFAPKPDTMLEGFKPNGAKDFTTEASMGEYIHQYFTGMPDSEQYAAVNAWVGADGCKDMQDFARGDVDGAYIEGLVQGLDDAADTHELKDDVNLYRGMALTQEQVAKFESDGSFKSKTFFTTAINAERVEKFFSGYSHDDDKDKMPTLFRIKGTKGTKGYFADARYPAADYHNGLGEFVPSRKNTYKIVGVQYLGSEDNYQGALIDMEIA